jgi:hypothetical protein
MQSVAARWLGVVSPGEPPLHRRWNQTVSAPVESVCSGRWKRALGSREIHRASGGGKQTASERWSGSPESGGNQSRSPGETTMERCSRAALGRFPEFPGRAPGFPGSDRLAQS